MKLYLNTSDNLKTIIKLDGQEFVTHYQSPRDQDVLAGLIQALRSSGKAVHDITSLEVHTGPGSFTGLRVGLSIAQALSLALNIPINDLAPGSNIKPNYGAPPSITLPQSK